MKKKRPSIGENPLDALLSPPAPRVEEKVVPVEKKVSRKRPAPAPVKEPAPARGGAPVKVTYNVAEDLVLETREAVRALAGPPLHLTLSALVETALLRELERLRKAHNAGKPFEGSGKALKGGRPLK